MSESSLPLTPDGSAPINHVDEAAGGNGDGDALFNLYTDGAAAADGEREEVGEKEEKGEEDLSGTAVTETQLKDGLLGVSDVVIQSNGVDEKEEEVEDLVSQQQPGASNSTTWQEDGTMRESCPSTTTSTGQGEVNDERPSTMENGSEVMASTVDEQDSITEQVSPRKEIKTTMTIVTTHQPPQRSGGEISPTDEVQGSCSTEERELTPSATERVSDVATGQRADNGQSVEIETQEEKAAVVSEEDSRKDATLVAPVSVVVSTSSPTHEDSSPVQKEEEEDVRELGPSPACEEEEEEDPSLSKEEIKPSMSAGGGEALSSLNGDESDFSPVHSERTSSNATSSSYIYTTDESMSPVKAVGKKPPPLPRTSSDPSLPLVDMPSESLEEQDTFHMSLMPSQYWQQSGEGQSSGVGGGGRVSKSKKIKRKGSMPEKIRSSITSVKRSLSTKRRGQTINLDDASLSNVSMLKPLTTQEWDPTCLLEELYSDYKQGVVTTMNPSGEAARHYGYLDKLPTNRTKANVMTKWKRRYFRAQEGNIYYYHDRTANRALGFIYLTSARVVPIPEKMQIQIIPKDGKSIMLKAPNVDEFQTWHRALLLEAAHPTMVAPSSPKPAIENPTVIIDIGACSVRAGLVREDPYPEIFFPAVCSFDAETYDVIECGHAALLPDNRIKALQVYPRKASLRMDRQRTELNLPLKAMDAIINNIVMQLDIDPQVAQLIMTLPPTVPEKERDELIDLLLETFGFAGICLQDQTQLALYSYNTTTGVIVDIGNHITVVPYIDGYAIEAGITRLPYGGNAITESVTKLVTQKGMRYFSETEMFVNRFIKESLCYVSQDYEEDSLKSEENPTDFIRVTEVDRFQLPDHRKMITLDSALFKATEGLFSPHVWGKDVLGLHEIVWKAIQACPIDQRRDLSKKILLSGGSSVLPGLKERLQKELSSLSPAGVAVEVQCNETCHHAAYCGASVLASLGSFQNCLLNFDDWSTAGAEALKKWTGS